MTGAPEGIRSAPDGIFNPPAPLPRARHADPEVLRQARHPCSPRPPGGDDGAPQRPAGVSLLRPVRPRLPDGLELRLQLRADLSGDGHGPRQGAGQRHGARADHRRHRQGDRRLLYRQDDRQEAQVRCRTVVLAASACESARLLLNSKWHGHPQGLANSSGMVGRYLMDTVGSSMSAMVPALVGHAALQLRRLRRPRLRAVVDVGPAKELNFARGYHIEVRRRLRHARHRLVHRGRQPRPKATACAMKQAIRDEYGTAVSLSGRGEMIPERAVVTARSIPR